MEIKTKAFDTVAIDPADIITFARGLIGFEDKQKFVLLGDPEKTEALVWLQSIEDQNLALVAIQPRLFRTDYKPSVHLDELKDLEVEDEADLLVYAIITVPSQVAKMTANLKAPVVINVKNNKAKQVILNDDRYKIKEPVFTEN